MRQVKQVKKTNYFPHDSNARNDERLVKLRMKHGAAGYGIYFMILERLREEADYMSAKDYNMIAFDLRVDTDIVKSVVEDFGLFTLAEDGECFYSESFSRRMSLKDALRRQHSNGGKAAMQKRWDKQTEGDNKDNAKTKTIIVDDDKSTEELITDNGVCLKRFFSSDNKGNLEVLLMNLGMQPKDITVLRKIAKDIIAEWELEHKQHFGYTDWSRHLISTMRIKAKEQIKPPKTEKTKPTTDYHYNGGFGGMDT